MVTSTDEEGVGHEGLEESHLLKCLLSLQLPQFKLHSLPDMQQEIIHRAHHHHSVKSEGEHFCIIVL